MIIKLLNKITEQIRSFSLFIYIFLLIFVVSLLFLWCVSDGHTFPNHEDESIYYNSARLFQETNSLKAVTCISEQRSYLGSHNWYGPAYQLIYGLNAKILGLSNINFIVFQYLLFLASLFLILFLNIEKTKKLFFYSIFLSTYAGYSFIFTYYPEVLQIFITIFLLVIYTNLGNSQKRLIIFIILILIFSFIRITNVFWIFSILFVTNSFISTKIRLIIVGLVFFCVIIYMKLFTAPAYSGVAAFSTIHNQNILEIDFIKIANVTIKNIFLNISRVYRNFHPSVILVLVLIIIAFYNLFKNRNRKDIFTSAGLLVVVLTSYLTLLSFYTTNHFFFEKQTAFLIPTLIFIIVSLSKDLILYTTLSLFVLLPVTIYKSIDNIKSRKLFYEKLNEYKDITNNMSKIKEHLKSKNSEINILYSYSEYSFPNNMISCFLPLSVGKTPILYTTNIVNEDSSVEEKFKFHGRIRIDYILSKSKLNFPYVDQVYENTYYYLYEVSHKKLN